MAPRTSLLGFAICALVACERESPPPPPSPLASHDPAPAPAGSSAPSSAPARPAIACRAIRAEGPVRVVGGVAVTGGTSLDGRSWVEIGDKGRVVFRHSTSARELEATGPALLLPFAGGEEEVLLARGRLLTSQGPGARPGAEVIVATPLGAVRYADASIEIRASGRQLSIASRLGEARIDPAAGTTLRGKHELAPRAQATVTGAPSLSSLLEACEGDAKDAESVARLVLAGPSDAGSLGERAARHVEARRKARVACAVAAAATATADASERQGAEARVAAAGRRWKAVPGTASTRPE